MDLQKARKLARECAHDYYPDSTEVETISANAYDLDGICMDHDPEWQMVRIWHDPEKNTFALENVPRQPIAEKFDKEQRLEEFLNKASIRQLMALMLAENQEELASIFAALSSTLAQSVRSISGDCGYDIDEIHRNLDSFFLEHPEL